jgi:membrane protease YdiL (CAAX protease family)
MTKQSDSAISWPTTIVAVIATALLSSYLVEFVYFAMQMASGRPETGPEELSFTFRLAVALLLQTSILAIVVRINGYRLTEYFGIRIPRMRSIVLTFVILSAMLLLGYVVGMGRAGSTILASDIRSVRLARDAGVEPVFFIVIVFIIPCCEETIYRGFLFHGLENSRIGAVGAVLVTTIFWSVMHIANGTGLLAFVVVLGLLFGWLRARTQSILLTSLLHGGANLTFMMVAYLRT